MPAATSFETNSTARLLILSLRVSPGKYNSEGGIRVANILLCNVLERDVSRVYMNEYNVTNEDDT